MLIDLSELIAHPLRTGIQRVERELLRHWPGPASLLPCRFDTESGTLLRLTDGAVSQLLDAEGATAPPADAAPALVAPDLAGQTIFNPELFYDRARAAFYRRLCGAGARRVSWLVYDFLPWLRPAFFSRRAVCNRMDYLLALRTVPRVAFISEDTRADFRRAIMRDEKSGGPVFPLGGDGLQLQKQKFDPGRQDFVVLGTIEPRKNVLAILEAFRNLWAKGVAAPLVLMGRVVAEAERERAMLAALAAQPLFTFVEHPTEATVRAALRGARALVTASAAEGFGLTPFEALAAGIPVIAPAGLPSIRLLPPAGQMRLARADAAEIESAVVSLLDDAVAARLFAEAEHLHVPTWRDFAHAIADWLQED